MDEAWNTIERKPRVGRSAVVVVLALLVVGTGGYEVGRRSAENDNAGAATPVSPSTAPAPTTSTTSAATTSTTAASTTTTSTVVPGPAGPFAGEWYHHGVQMVIDTTGHGLFIFRLYRYCTEGPPPCDVSVGNNIWDGGFATFTISAQSATDATATVVTSTASDSVPIGDFRASYEETTDVLTLTFPGQEPLAMCGPRSGDVTPPPPCGA
jgi:hypothetical protein